MELYWVAGPADPFSLIVGELELNRRSSFYLMAMTLIDNKQGFTIATATATLPLVKRIVGELVTLAQEISDTQERLAYTVSDRENQVDVYSKELRSVEAETEKKSLLLEGCMNELLELNVLTGSVTEGFVDFPALRNQEKICLCWRQGEEKVMHWHLIDEPCKQRRLVDLQLVQKSVERQLASAASVLKS